MANDTIAKPFGAIDTPTQGQTLSGPFAVFGWALTPDSDTAAGAGDILVPTNGSTMVVFIDGVAVGNVAYNQCRGTVGNPVPSGLYCNDDVANVFGNPTPRDPLTTRTANPTKYRNLDAGRAAIGAFSLDTTTLNNGVHTLAWGVTDSDGRADGIGSRYFTVLNSGADTDGDPGANAPGLRTSLDAASMPPIGSGAAEVRGRTGFDLAVPYDTVPADEAGVRHVRLPELGRLELQLGAVDAGYLAANGTRRELPAGSRLDPATGAFTWAPGPGYFGTYRLVFGADEQPITVDVTIRPIAAAALGASEIRMQVDLPRDDEVLAGTVRIAGWALDPQAAIGSGIGAVHVWAQRRDVAGAWPEFLGAAALGGARPDVAQAIGAQFNAAAFELTTTALAPGQYDLTVYVWNRRTARWEDARTIAVTIR
jgi:hypothetical protein